MLDTALEKFNSIIKSEPITKGFVNQIYDYNPLLNLLQKGNAHLNVTGGARIEFGLEALTFTGTHWSGRGAVTNPSTTQAPQGTEWVKGYYDWALYNLSVKIPFKEWALLQQGDDHVMIDLAERVLNSASASVARDFEKIIFTPYLKSFTNPSNADNNKPVFGLQELVDTGHVTIDDTPYYVGDINETTYPQWKATQYTFDPDLGYVKNLYAILTNFTSQYPEPDIIITSFDVFKNLAYELYDKAAFQIKDELITKLGFKSGLTFDGIPIVFTPAIATPSVEGDVVMYMLNFDYLKFVTHPEYNFKISDFKPVGTENYDMLAMVDVISSLACTNRQAQVKVVLGS